MCNIITHQYTCTHVLPHIRSICNARIVRRKSRSFTSTSTTTSSSSSSSHSYTSTTTTTTKPACTASPLLTLHHTTPCPTCLYKIWLQTWLDKSSRSKKFLRLLQERDGDDGGEEEDTRVVRELVSALHQKMQAEMWMWSRIEGIGLGLGFGFGLGGGREKRRRRRRRVGNGNGNGTGRRGSVLRFEVKKKRKRKRKINRGMRETQNGIQRQTGNGNGNATRNPEIQQQQENLRMMVWGLELESRIPLLRITRIRLLGATMAMATETMARLTRIFSTTASGLRT